MVNKSQSGKNRSQGTKSGLSRKEKEFIINMVSNPNGINNVYDWGTESLYGSRYIRVPSIANPTPIIITTNNTNPSNPLTNPNGLSP